MIINTNGVNTSIYPQLVINATVGTVIKVSKGPHLISMTAENEITIIDVPEYGTWAVTCTVNGNTSEQMLEIDTVKQYEISVGEDDQVVNYTMLYGGGNEFEEITNGWVSNKYIDYHANAGNVDTAVKNSNSIYLGFTSKQSSGTKDSSIACNNKINTTGYSKLVTVLSSATSTLDTWGDANNIALSPVETSLASADCFKARQYEGVNINDISAYQGDFYLAFVTISGKDAYCNLTFTDVLLVKSDNWQKWTEIGGITGFTDINALVNDSSSMTALMSNETAVRYMVKQMTGDAMFAILNSEIAMSALDNSPYKSLVQANEHWAKFLAMVA